jgi:hypothetical protein
MNLKVLNLVDIVVKATNPNIPNEQRPKLTRQDCQNLAMYFYDDAETKRYAQQIFEEFHSKLGWKEFMERFGEQYEVQVATVYAELLNGQKNTYYFFSALAATIRNDVAEKQKAGKR